MHGFKVSIKPDVMSPLPLAITKSKDLLFREKHKGRTFQHYEIPHFFFQEKKHIITESQNSKGP